MTPIEILAVLILIIAILILFYYYLQNNPHTLNRIKSSTPSINYSTGQNLNVNEGFQDVSGRVKETFSGDNIHEMGDKVKDTFKGVSSSTDNITHKIDKFLDEKSEEVISDWSLATLDDISSLEERFEITTNKIDSLEERFENFSDYTNEKLNEFESRLEKIEDNSSEE